MASLLIFILAIKPHIRKFFSAVQLAFRTNWIFDQKPSWNYRTSLTGRRSLDKTVHLIYHSNWTKTDIFNFSLRRLFQTRLSNKWPDYIYVWCCFARSWPVATHIVRLGPTIQRIESRAWLSFDFCSFRSIIWIRMHITFYYYYY